MYELITDPPLEIVPGDPMALEEYTDILFEIEDQPAWRSQADKEMDYADGNQLGSELLKKQAELGIPPAIEDLIGPAMLSIQGYEAATRTDWRVTAAGGQGAQDVADALNQKLNEAERSSKADNACSEAFRPQAAIGVGWVEVSRDSDPFEPTYRCTAVHRNEITWDFAAKSKDLKDARWLRRHRWLRPERIILAFPAHKALIRGLGRYGANWWAESRNVGLDGGHSTGLENGWANGRGWSVEESRWHNPTSRELCLSELWYRRWESVPVLTSPDGRVVEFDEDNRAHIVALSTGMAKMTRANVAKVRRAYWLGPHLLDDAPTPYTHTYFPYVPFWGFREDRTHVPYGYVRGMIYQQDSLNSGNSKLRWGMSVVRTERTKGAVEMTDAQLRRQVGRADADIVLNAAHMAQPGARFEIKRDYQLTEQHFQMLQENRAAIERVSSVTAGFQGKQGTATSGVQEQTQVEQSNQALGHMMTNFREARSQVGELLMAMLIEDMGTGEQTVIIEGDAVRDDRTVILNKPEADPVTGEPYRSNDVQRTRLKVALEDVPSTSSYRGQQLNALSEMAKSLPDEYKAAVVPFLVSLTDAPHKKEIVEALRAVDQKQTPEQIQQAIDAAVKDALAKAQTDLKMRELELKYPQGMDEAKVALIRAQSLETGIKATFSAIQTAGAIVQTPQISPVADSLLMAAGYRPPSPPGIDPNLPIPEAVPLPMASAAGVQPGLDAGGVPAVQINTSPNMPPVPQQPASPMQGIETFANDSEALNEGAPV
jgi:hypothetical protein